MTHLAGAHALQPNNHPVFRVLVLTGWLLGPILPSAPAYAVADAPMSRTLFAAMATIAMENLRPLPECRAYLGRFRELINDTKLSGPAFDVARRALWLEARPCFMPSPPNQAAIRPPQAMPIKATPTTGIANSGAM